MFLSKNTSFYLILPHLSPSQTSLFTKLIAYYSFPSHKTTSFMGWEILSIFQHYPQHQHQMNMSSLWSQLILFVQLLFFWLYNIILIVKSLKSHLPTWLNPSTFTAFRCLPQHQSYSPFHHENSIWSPYHFHWDYYKGFLVDLPWSWLSSLNSISTTLLYDHL